MLIIIYIFQRISEMLAKESSDINFPNWLFSRVRHCLRIPGGDPPSSREVNKRWKWFRSSKLTNWWELNKWYKLYEQVFKLVIAIKWSKWRKWWILSKWSKRRKWWILSKWSKQRKWWILSKRIKWWILSKRWVW